MNTAFQKVYTKITQITKATCSLKAQGVGNDELAIVNGRLAQVVKIWGEDITLQVFSGTEGIPTNAEVTFLGKAPTLKVGEDLCGRFFNAFGDPIDGGPAVDGEEREIGGPSVNPVRRKQPSELIATGIAGIDLNNTLVSGQKIPFFADPDQPYNQVMANVALRAQTDRIILGGMGLTNDDYLYFKNLFDNAGVLDRIVSFVNTTEAPPVERLLVPDMALTAAEYFAVDKNEKVLVLLTDMTLYADALSIVSNRMDQIPSKDSMPGSLYSDLAKIYEKAVQGLRARRNGLHPPPVQPDGHAAAREQRTHALRAPEAPCPPGRRAGLRAREDEAHRQQTLYLNEGDTVNLLDHETHDALVKQVRQTSPAQPDVTIPATLHIAGEDKPYALTVRTVWLPGDGAYSYALGQFRPEGGGH